SLQEISESRRGPIVGHPSKDLYVKPEDDAAAGAAEAHRVLDQGFQHGLQVEGRAADHLEDFAGGSLLLQGLGEVAVSRLELAQQARVLDGDDRLVGEGRDQLDLLVGEGLDYGSMQGEESDKGVLSDHGDAQQGPEAEYLLCFGFLILRVRQDVGDMNGP